MSHHSLQNEVSILEDRLREVISLCNRLRQENRALQDQQKDLVEERARLIEKNELARARVEQMITRLKSMETSQ